MFFLHIPPRRCAMVDLDLEMHTKFSTKFSTRLNKYLEVELYYVDIIYYL
jgi:hypothetical protein